MSIPSAYRNHPVLCWGTIAHEVGGHDILHSYPGLLLEIQRTCRETVYPGGTDPNGQVPTSEEQFKGLLWQYWAEEVAADVCAVLNLGPAYGKGAAVFLAAFNERIFRWMDSLDGNESPKMEDPALTKGLHLLCPLRKWSAFVGVRSPL